MRALPIALVLTCCLGALSCSDMPTAPVALVHVQGSVVDRDGAGVDRVRIYFAPNQKSNSDEYYPPYPTGQVTTDSQGAFQLDLAEGDYRADLIPSYDGMPRVTIGHFEVSRDASHPTFQFLGSYLYGRVVGPNGTELPSVDVQAYGLNTNTSATYEGASPFRLLLPPGPYRLRISGASSSALPMLDTTVVVADHDDSLRTALTGYLVRVHVTTNQTTPIPGATIETSSLTSYYGYSAATTDLNGDASLYLRSGGYALRIRPLVPGMLPWSFFEVIQGDAQLAYDLTPVRWTGTTRSGENGSPIPFAYIDISELGINYSSAPANSDVDGKFEVLVRPGASYQARAVSNAPLLLSPPMIFSLAADSTFDLLLYPRSSTIFTTPTPPTPVPQNTTWRTSFSR